MKNKIEIKTAFALHGRNGLKCTKDKAEIFADTIEEQFGL